MFSHNDGDEFPTLDELAMQDRHDDLAVVSQWEAGSEGQLPCTNEPAANPVDRRIR